MFLINHEISLQVSFLTTPKVSSLNLCILNLCIFMHDKMYKIKHKIVNWKKKESSDVT